MSVSAIVERVSVAGGVPEPFARRSAVVERRRSRVVRGVNLLAELEALTILGSGRFEVGVNHALNVFRAVPLADHDGAIVESPFADRRDKRHWRLAIYEDDAYLLARMGSTASVGLSHVVGVAWPHVHSAYRERFAARLTELPDDALARSWQAAGGAPWWAPAPASGAQAHFVLDASDSLHSDGVRR